MSSKYRLRGVAVLFAMVVAGLGASPAISQVPGRALSPEEIEAIYSARADSALMRFSAADVAFVAGMIHHHAQAITMSEMAPTHGASPVIRTLAARIINGQRDEIETMQRWLGERGQPVPEVPGIGDHTTHGASGLVGSQPDGHADHMASAEHVAAEDHADMPGVLTPEQMARLDAARGEEFDRLYLTFMIFHHEGAVTMVDDLVATDGALQGEALFRLASDIQAEQRTEIDRMSLMLKEMTGSPLGPALLEIR